jgi:hypothetical protein
MDSEELQHLQTLRAKYVRNLRRLEEQRAEYGLDVPTKIANEIEQFERLIEDIDRKLQWEPQEGLQDIKDALVRPNRRVVRYIGLPLILCSIVIFSRLMSSKRAAGVSVANTSDRSSLVRPAWH